MSEPSSPDRIVENEPRGSFSTIRLLVAYNGKEFHGLAPNPGVRTVVGEIQKVLELLLGCSPSLIMSGRTDAGVHAWGQVLSFEMQDGRVPLERLKRTLNRRLSPEIVVREAVSAERDFSARFSAKSRCYRYKVLNRSTMDPFLSDYSWWVPDELDLDAMTAGSNLFIGEHDFSSFCRRPKKDGGKDLSASLRREILSAEWQALSDDVLEFEISGSAFCHQMVRSVVGFLVAIGKGKRLSSEVEKVLEAKDRSYAEQLAPSHGLTLWSVEYDL